MELEKIPDNMCWSYNHNDIISPTVDSSLIDADSGTTINESEILTLMESGAEDSDFGDLPEDHKIITQQK